MAKKRTGDPWMPAPVYADPDFAVLRCRGMEWTLHADHTYEKQPLAGFVKDLAGRGAGALAEPHGLREAYLLDPDGYCRVPSRPGDPA